MNLRAAFARSRAARARLREERALVRAIAAAPTLESAHELSALLAHR